MEDYPVKSKGYALLHFFMSSNYSKKTSLCSLVSCIFWLKADQRAAKLRKTSAFAHISLRFGNAS